MESPRNRTGFVMERPPLETSAQNSLQAKHQIGSIRVLVVDDYEPWRRFIRLALLAHNKLQVIGEVSDGLEAVEKAQQLQPDLILLDIGLPTLNGIEAAHRIREVSPTSKILFVSENRSHEIAQEALRNGAGGYIVKSDVSHALLPGIRAILEGKRFISPNFASQRPAPFGLAR